MKFYEGRNTCSSRLSESGDKGISEYNHNYPQIAGVISCLITKIGKPSEYQAYILNALWQALGDIGGRTESFMIQGVNAYCTTPVSVVKFQIWPVVLPLLLTSSIHQ